jgi:ATP-dependent DNA helicase RecQ
MPDGAQFAESPRDVLRRVFGFPDFRGLQADAVNQVVGGGDALVLMPTGGGKSVCYQVPALVRHGVAVVISPLIALMDDQVAALRQLGVSAGALHSEVEPDDASRTSRALTDGTLDLLYVSPERLMMSGTLERLWRQEIALIAVDEAHCVSNWGHEFRPEYRTLRRLKQDFPGVPRIALTATADPRTRADILDALDMADAAVFAASFHRNNLHIAAKPKTGEMQQLSVFLKSRPGQAGIVYCGSRSKTERVTQSLRTAGHPAIAFHAGLSAMEKRVALQRFRSGEAVVMVATIAFGMGIDRPDVRFVVHLDMPDSPEAYYQQIGRAGRDGDRADTLLLYGGEDIMRARHWLDQSTAPESERRVRAGRLEAMISLTETPECRTRSLLACFGETLGEPCGHCDTCANPVNLFDGTVAAQKVLSAIYRTGQMFGALHITAVLRGERNPMVDKHNHDRLSTWGVGADQPEGFWRGVIRQLVAIGALQRGEGERAGLALVPDRARPILRGEATVMLREETPDPIAGRSRSRNRASVPVADADVPAGPFEALRAWRSAEAKSQAVPAYVIFQDTVLREIAAVQPRSLDDLALVKGVGASKLERYGDDILRVLKEAA